MTSYRNTIRTCCNALFDYQEGTINKEEFDRRVKSVEFKSGQIPLPISLNKDSLNVVEQTKGGNVG